MTKQEAHKWLNERADNYLEQSREASNKIFETSVDTTTQRVIAKLSAIEDLLADLIDKHF